MTAAWERGDAVAPLDMRLPRPALQAAIAALDPTAIVDAEGLTSRRGQGAEEGDAAVLVTSGTTSDPKAVVLSKEAIEASAAATSARLGVQPDQDVWLACIPLSHVGGFSVVCRAILGGSKLVVHERFDAQAAMEVAATAPTLVSLVPAAYRQIRPEVFSKILLGGAAPPEGLAENVVTTYGLTESGSGVVYDGVPLSGVEISFGNNNEILIRAPMLGSRYRNGTPVADADGWFHTGDGGAWDDSGRLIVHGRISEVINTGGEKVWPTEVEAVLSRDPSVSEVAVWRRPDPKWGERVVAWVVPSKGQEPLLADLAGVVRESLSPWAAPKELVLVDFLPRTPSGKLRRSALE